MRREVTAGQAKIKGPRPEGSGAALTPADIAKIIAARRATVYRYLSMGRNEPV